MNKIEELFGGIEAAHTFAQRTHGQTFLRLRRPGVQITLDQAPFWLAVAGQIDGPPQLHHDQQGRTSVVVATRHLHVARFEGLRGRLQNQGTIVAHDIGQSVIALSILPITDEARATTAPLSFVGNYERVSLDIAGQGPVEAAAHTLDAIAHGADPKINPPLFTDAHAFAQLAQIVMRGAQPNLGLS